MTFHRLSTPNLPSIRVHDHHTMEASNDNFRSRPLPIPAPKHGSPTSSRSSSFHGPPAPPPILSLDLPSIPPPHSSEKRTEWKDGDGAENMRHRWPGDVRGGWGSSNQLSSSSPRGWGSPGRSPRDLQNELPGSFEGLTIKKKETSQSWPDDFRGRRKPPTQTNKDRLPSEVSIRAAMQKSARAYDEGLIGKLNGSARSEPLPFPRQPFTPPRETRQSTVGSGPDEMSPSPARWDLSRDHSRSGSISNPIPSPGSGSLDTPLERWSHGAHPLGEGGRWGAAPEQHPPVFPPTPSDIRKSGDNASPSPYMTEDEIHSGATARMRRSMSASILTSGLGDSPSPNNYDLFPEDLQMDDAPTSHVSQMRRLTLDAQTLPKSSSYPAAHRHQRAGSKRRASSPPDVDRKIGNSEPTRKGLHLEGYGSSDIYDHGRRTSPIHQGVRNSPSGPFKFHPFGSLAPRSASGSVTSASISSTATTWSTSIGQSSVASSFTTVDRTSPASSFSSPVEMEVVGDPPFRQSPLSTAARPSSRQKPFAEIAAGREKESVSSTYSSVLKMGGVLICECCPKKPKKFENPKDLQLHAMEKQYSCVYCNNRFKNKNEAERHQNSLHLRKHSWSCAVLSSNYQAAFHVSPQHPSSCEICGFCGKEFPSPPLWDERIEHLTIEHKFGECNQSKKFYRADHFRQHLKHSHSGTSGKWTNVLENACMKDEIPPTSSRHGSAGSGNSVTISAEGLE